MGIMTRRALLLCIPVDFLLQNVIFVMAIKAEHLWFGDKEKRIGRTVGRVAHRAATGCEGAVDLFLLYIELMAFKTELLERHDKLIAPPEVAPLAQFGSIGTMLPVRSFLERDFFALLLSSRTFCLLASRYPVEEKAQYLMSSLPGAAIHKCDQGKQNDR